MWLKTRLRTLLGSEAIVRRAGEDEEEDSKVNAVEAEPEDDDAVSEGAASDVTDAAFDGEGCSAMGERGPMAMIAEGAVWCWWERWKEKKVVRASQSQVQVVPRRHFWPASHE